MSPSPKQNLRDLGTHDAAWLAALHAECVEPERRWSENLFASFLATPAAFGRAAVKNGMPLAFLLGQSAGDEAEIVTLATHPAARRQGYADVIVNDFCETMRSRHKTRLFLEVAINNLAAIGLYTKHGFTQSGLRPHYYQKADGEFTDALILQKNLIA